MRFIIELLFSLLIHRLGGVKPQDLEVIREDAFKWNAENLVKIEEKRSSPFLIKLYAWGELWYIKLAMIGVYIWASRELIDFMNPKSRDEHDDDEYDD